MLTKHFRDPPAIFIAHRSWDKCLKWCNRAHVLDHFLENLGKEDSGKNHLSAWYKELSILDDWVINV